MSVVRPIELESPTRISEPRLSAVMWLGLLGVALLVRLPFALDPGLTGDEASYVLFARCSAGEILTGEVIEPSNPPLFMLALHGLLRAGGTQVWAWKLMTVVMNLGALVAAVVLARRWIGITGAILVGLLMAINPWQAYMATEVRGYALAGLCAMVALEAADRFERRGSPWAAVLWALACGAGFWTHYSVAVVGLVTGVYTLIRVRRQPRRLAGWCVAGAGAVAIMLLWLPMLGRQDIQIGGRPEAFWHLAGLPVVQCLGTTYLRPGIPKLWLAVGSVAALAVFVPVALAGAVRLYRTQRGVLWLLIGLMAVSVLAPLVRSAALHSLAFSTRYTFIANVTVLLFVAAGLSSFRPRLRIAAALGIVALSGISFYQFAFTYVGRSFWPEIVAQTRAVVPADEALLFPDVINALRVQFFSGGGFAPSFVEGRDAADVGFVPPDGTWREFVRAMRRPQTFYTVENQAKLRGFAAVWYWQLAESDVPPCVLGGGYRFDRAVALLPGGQFGAERPVRLVRFCRAP